MTRSFYEFEQSAHPQWPLIPEQPLYTECFEVPETLTRDAAEEQPGLHTPFIIPVHEGIGNDENAEAEEALIDVEPPAEHGGGAPPIDIPPEAPPPAAGEPEEPDEPSEPEDGHEGPNEELEVKPPIGTLAAMAKKIIEEKNKEHIGLLIEEENSGLEWPVFDSVLEGEDWDAVEHTFKGIIPPKESTFREFIERNMEDVPDKNAIEVGGPGSRLFAGFTPGTFEKTIGVNLTDPRKRAENSEELIAEDVARGHIIIAGNLMSEEVHQQVEAELGGKKAGLIIERMVGGLRALPNNPFTMAKEVTFWYGQLADGGTLFAEAPYALRDYVEEWKEMIKEQHPGLEVKTAPILFTFAVRITKREGAPAELPLLPVRRVLEVDRYNALLNDNQENEF